MKTGRGHCGSWSWKWKQKGGNGCDGDWPKKCRLKLTAKAEFSPRNGRKAWHRRRQKMQLRTAFGTIALEVWYGQNPSDKSWGCPMRERWGLSAHQQLSPALEDKLAYFATVTGSYEAAAKLAAKVGCPVEDSTIRALVQRLGSRAEAQTQERLKKVAPEKSPQR